MSDFLGYVGTLFEINSNESTVSLENVRSHGTEGRKGDPTEEVSASDQVYDFIVFRGSDVKDLRIEEGPAAPKENQPPMPNDPAIVGVGSDLVLRLAHPVLADSPWAILPHKDGSHLVRVSRPTDLVLGTTTPSLRVHHQLVCKDLQRQTPVIPPNTLGPQGESRPAPIGAGTDKPNRLAHAEEPNVHSQSPAAPTPPNASKPSAEEVQVTATLLENQNAGPQSVEAKKIPTGPRGLTKITPAVPLPAALTAKAAQSLAAAGPNSNNGNPAASAAALKDATEAAKAAVAVAMAKLEGGSGAAAQASNGVDNLTRKVDEMRVNAARSGAQSQRGRGRGGPRHTKVEVPDSDYDFATANAKFNKEDVVKERIAGSPINETPQDEDVSEAEKALSGEPKEAYNKTKSFFDNISSEAKDRKDNNGQKPGGREWRGEEQRRNMETFGQGSVDGGSYRGYRGRGRGRGGLRGRGFGGRGRGAYRGVRTDGQVVPQ
ncbi:hypothetical protein VPNG_05058 [Cytospora leucostoma]|uniref:DFDF domain-containing protein n=1 Tax=Cytospora leucostoma TaxID=1230097 RepID=A0A423X4J0_9PEZI|nr:hypothetical protein VPNG_05058 [Cytospora leucostoma]